MRTFEIGDVTSRAWKLTINNWPVFVLLVILTQAVGSLGTSIDTDLLEEYGQSITPEQLPSVLQQIIVFDPILILLGFLLTTFLSIITYKMLVNCIRTGKPYDDLAKALKIDFAGFASYLGVAIIVSIVVVIAAILGGAIGAAIVFMMKDAPIALVTLLVVILACAPAAYISVRWAFAPIAIASDNVSLLDAFRISWGITKGNFWKIVVLAFASAGIIILGFCVCLIGLIPAMVMAKFMFAVAYVDLRDGAEIADDRQSPLGNYIK